MTLLPDCQWKVESHHASITIALRRIWHKIHHHLLDVPVHHARSNSRTGDWDRTSTKGVSFCPATLVASEVLSVSHMAGCYVHILCQNDDTN